MAKNPLSDIQLSKEELQEVSPANKKLMADLEKRTLEFINFQMRLQKQIDQKKNQLITQINKGTSNPDPKVKMFAASLYNQITK